MGLGTPIIPPTITVHLGSPKTAARNVTVTFRDYIKNVTCIKHRTLLKSLSK